MLIKNVDLYLHFIGNKFVMVYMDDFLALV